MPAKNAKKPGPKSRRQHGEGTIVWREDKQCFEAKINLGTNAEGKRLRRSVYAKTTEEVVEKLRRLNTLKATHQPVAIDKQRVGEYLEDWLSTSVEVRLRPRTVESYSELVRLHLVPALGHLRLTDLRVDHVRLLIKEKLASGLSARRVQYIRAVLRSALQRAVKDGRVAVNAAALSESVVVERDEVVPLTPEETSKLMTALVGHRFEVPFLLYLTTGARRAEILGLPWENVDLDNGAILIRQQVTKLSPKQAAVYRQKVKAQIPGFIRWLTDREYLALLKSKKSRRDLPLLPAITARLKQLKAEQAAQQLAAGPEWAGHGLVFTDEVGQPFTGAQLTHAWDRVLADSGLPAARLHDARHGAGSMMLEGGADLKTVSAFLGHSTIQLTADTYAHVRKPLMQDAANRLAEVLRLGAVEAARTR